MKKLIFISIAILSSGCTTAPVPISGDKARLTIEVPDLKDGGFHLQSRSAQVDIFVDDKGCPWGENDFVLLSDTYLFSLKFSRGENVEVVDIPVGKDVYFLMHDAYAQTCTQTARFKLILNGEYI